MTGHADYIDAHARQLLADAANYIATNGHNKGTSYGGDDPLSGHAPACALGAIQHVKTSSLHDPHHVDIWTTAIKLLVKNLPEEFRDFAYPDCSLLEASGSNVIWWNDDPATSAEDVILAFKRAASE